MAEHLEKKAREMPAWPDPGCRSQKRSLTASEQKALEIVLRLMEIGAIPNKKWEAWKMGPVGPFPFYPLENPPGEEKERRVDIEAKQYSLSIRLCKSSKGEWFPLNLSIYNKAKDKIIRLEGYESIDFLLSLAD